MTKYIYIAKILYNLEIYIEIYIEIFVKSNLIKNALFNYWQLIV